MLLPDAAKKTAVFAVGLADPVMVPGACSSPREQGTEARDKRRDDRHESRKLKQARRSRAGTVDLLRRRIRACYSPRINLIIARPGGFVKKKRENGGKSDAEEKREGKPGPAAREGPSLHCETKIKKKLSKNDKNILTNE